jgi:hypothetical protein
MVFPCLNFISSAWLVTGYTLVTAMMATMIASIIALFSPTPLFFFIFYLLLALFWTWLILFWKLSTSLTLAFWTY